MMLRKLPVAMIAALALAAAAHAQESPAPAGPPAQPPAAAPPAPAAAAPRTPSNSERQMQDFARATVELQALDSQDPGAMTRAIEGAGMSVEEYNGMGDAMRANPALAASLTPYLDSANVERTARITREATQGLDRRWSPPPRHTAPVRKAAAHGKARAHKGKAATSHRHAAKHSSRAATSKHATHHRRHKG
jgi:hypothetical protein